MSRPKLPVGEVERRLQLPGHGIGVGGPQGSGRLVLLRCRRQALDVVHGRRDTGQWTGSVGRRPPAGGSDRSSGAAPPSSALRRDGRSALERDGNHGAAIQAGRRCGTPPPRRARRGSSAGYLRWTTSSRKLARPGSPASVELRAHVRLPARATGRRHDPGARMRDGRAAAATRAGARRASEVNAAGGGGWRCCAPAGPGARAGRGAVGRRASASRCSGAGCGDPAGRWSALALELLGLRQGERVDRRSAG